MKKDSTFYRQMHEYIAEALSEEGGSDYRLVQKQVTDVLITALKMYKTHLQNNPMGKYATGYRDNQ